MNRSINKLMKRTTLIGVSLCMAIGLAACSGGNGSPASPSAFPSAGATTSGATTISGTAVAGGGTTGQSTGLSTPTFGALDSHSGLRVCVVGTNICVEVGPSGTFELSGDFVGDVELHITGPGHDVFVTVTNVQSGQTIIVSITLNGDVGSLQVESRQEGAAGPKVELCHVTGNGSHQLIEVDANAQVAHEAHGDGFPGELVPTDPSLIFDDDCAILGPAIDIEKFTNGENADEAPGPSVLVGTTVMWTYEVTNTGDVTLTDVVVTDSMEAVVICPLDALGPGDSMTCTASGVAVEGQYDNTGTVTANFADAEVTDSDDSHYVGEVEEPEDEDEEPGEGAEKVELCHLTGNGSFRHIEVSVNALPAHMAHGDVVPIEGSCTDPVPS